MSAAATAAGALAAQGVFRKRKFNRAVQQAETFLLSKNIRPHRAHQLAVEAVKESGLKPR